MMFIEVETIKNCCEFLIEHAKKIINFKKKKNGIVNKKAPRII